MTDAARAIGPRRARARRFAREAGLAAAGVVAGVLAKIADEASVGWASDLGDHPGMWVFIIAVVGWASVTAARAAVRAGLFSVGLCAGYYAWSTAVFGFGWGRFVFAWLALAAIAVPVAAAAVWWATRRDGAGPGVVIGGVAALIVGGGAIRGVWLYAAGHLPGFAVRPVQAVLEFIMVVVLVAGLPRHPRTKLWAGAMLVPAWWMPDLVNRFVGLLT